MSEAETRRVIEMLFFAYREFTSEPDEILEEYGFGRAHHRVLYFVGRTPGITVSDLLATLKITKQSLSRVLRQLLDEGFVEQYAGKRDRRQRLLYLTSKGERLEQALYEAQRRQIWSARSENGKADFEAFKKVLFQMIHEDDRHQLEEKND